MMHDAQRDAKMLQDQVQDLQDWIDHAVLCLKILDLILLYGKLKKLALTPILHKQINQLVERAVNLE